MLAVANMLHGLLKETSRGDLVADSPWLLALLFNPMLNLLKGKKLKTKLRQALESLLGCVFNTFLDAEFDESFLGIWLRSEHSCVNRFG